MAEIDAEDVARLRIALARITRALDRQSRGHTLTGTQASVLATAARLGPVRITELAEIEGINPTMLSRIVGKLEDAGLLHRARPIRTTGAPPSSSRPTAGRELQRRVREERTRLLAEHLASAPGRARRRSARRAARPRGARHGAPHRATPEGPRLTTLAGVGRQTFSSLANPNYRRYTRGQAVSLAGTWMQIDRPVLAGARAHRLGAPRSAPSSPSRPCRRCCSARTRGVVADRMDKRRLMIGAAGRRWACSRWRSAC